MIQDDEIRLSQQLDDAGDYYSLTRLSMAPGSNVEKRFQLVIITFRVDITEIVKYITIKTSGVLQSTSAMD
ncbi:hypothetical protein TNCV_4182301 [Trichonephila clavipes]|nr:hypothetical protein TNCV_4182301 [Trichonephila clavipes]